VRSPVLFDSDQFRELVAWILAPVANAKVGRDPSAVSHRTPLKGTVARPRSTSVHEVDLEIKLLPAEAPVVLSGDCSGSFPLLAPPLDYRLVRGSAL